MSAHGLPRQPGPPGNSFTRTLSAALLGTSDVAAAAEPAPADREPLQRQNTSELNRNRVQENQRIIAAQLLMVSLPVMGCIIILVLGLLVAGFVIYVQGWMVVFHTKQKSCDQPLYWWLLAMLLVPILQIQLNSFTESEQRRKSFQALLMPIGIMIGVYMHSHCKTCADTNPELFYYTKVYLIYQFAMWLLTIVGSCALVYLVFWLHRNGLLESGPGPAAAARPGLIDDIETVRFHPDQFSSGVDVESPECPICQVEYELDEELKRTPCGHYFHRQCLGDWLGNYGKSCPLCRKNLEEACEQREGV